MQTQDEIRFLLKTYKKDQRYTWLAFSDLLDVNVHWLRSFINDVSTDYSYSVLRSISKFLEEEKNKEDEIQNLLKNKEQIN